MMKVVFGVLSALAVLTSCADPNEAMVPKADAASDAAGRQFASPPPGNAALYIFRGDRSQPYVFAVSIGQMTLANIGTRTWSRADLPAGKYDVRCSGGTEATASVLMTLAAGETRFIEVEAEVFRVGCALKEVPASVGRAGVLRGKRVREL